MHDTLAQSIIAFHDGLAKCHRAEDRALVSSYLAALAPILAKATVGSDILNDLQDIERLFGNSWVIDELPFQTAFNYWRQFKDAYERLSLGAMTVNERLCALNLMSDFDSAESNGDKNKMQTILKRVFVDDDSIHQIITKA